MCGLQCADVDMLPTIIKRALEHGVIVLKSGKGVVRFLPALTITQEEIDEGTKRLKNALDSLLS